MPRADASQATGTVYYVDFDNGDDTRDGRSKATSWRNIPGTRTTADTDWLGGTSGWSKIVAGDTVSLRAGTTHDFTKGGRILIDQSWYGQGTAASPITIKVDPGWGSGQTVIDGSNITVSGWRGLFEVSTRDYVILDGQAANAIKIQNSGYYGYASTGNHNTIRYVEVYNSTWANVIFVSPSFPSYAMGATVDSVVAHKTNTNDDWAANIFLTFVDGALVKNSIAYDSNPGADGIHLGSCRNSWVLDCVTYSNGEQGIDISRDGDYKYSDDSYNITVRNCVSHDNYKQNFDSNSASRDIYFINNLAWRTTINEGGDANYQVYEGGNRVFFINCTSAAGHDHGFGVAWWSAYYNLAAGSYKVFIINSISSGEGGHSVDVENDLSGRSYAVSYLSSDFDSADASGAVVVDKSTAYARAEIAGATGGWPGSSCLSVSPQFTATGSTWATTDLGLQPTSPCRTAGVFPLTTSAAGTGTTLTVAPVVPELDLRRVFRAGDTLQIEGSGKFMIASVDSATQVTLTSPGSWQSNKGVWLPWPGDKVDIGAM